MYIFELPEIGEGVVEGEIVRWLVNEGDAIAADQPVCEVMTDKATVEISTPKGGRVARTHGKPGDVVKVHSPLLEIDLDGKAAATVQAPAPAPARPAKGKADVSPPPAPAASAPKVEAAPPPAPRAAAPAPAVAAKMPPPPGQKALASPAVRHAARGAGVDIDAVAGTGRGGRVTRADVDAVVAHPGELRAPPALPAPAAGDERVKIIGLRRKIAEKMTQAYRTAPHFTYVDEVDATKLVELRRTLLPLAEARGVKLSFLPFIFKALGVVLREFPTLNAVMDEDDFALVLRRDVNIGLATDTPAGLYVPVLRNVDQKSILEIAAEMADVTQRTRDSKVRLDELQGGSFTVTSVGNLGGRFATPILNHPEVAILGVNQIHERPVVRDGQIVIRSMLYLSPSFDHRVIDGATGARFVNALKARLEAPESLLLELR